MRSLVVLVCSLFVTLSLSAQFKKIKEIEFIDPVVSLAVDRPGEVYVTTEKDHLQRYDVNGKLLSLYKDHPFPTLFDPRDGSRLFAYYRDTQQFAYLNSSFEDVNRLSLDSAFAIEPWLICASGDYNIWVLDAADFSIKKINTRDGHLLVELLLPDNFSKEKLNYIGLREYQGFLFISDKSGQVHILSSMGKYLRSLSITNPTSINFLGEELYYVNEDTLHFFDLFTTETRIQRLPEPATYAILTDERLFLAHGKMVNVFEVRDQK